MIISRLSGGMGNQMFQYAVGRALAIKHNVPLALDLTFLSNQTAIPFIRPTFARRSYALDLFNIHASVATREEIPWYGRPFFSGIVMQCIDAFLRKLPVIRGWEKRFNYDPEVFELGPNTYLSGFWQSYKYFDHIKDVIRADFQLLQPLSDHAQQLQQEIVRKNAACMNIRRSDYTTTGLHGIVGIEYFSKGLKLLQEKTPVDHIYVFSEDIEWCKEHLRFDVPITYVGPEYSGNKDSEYFVLMSCCKHFIISNSTYAWWAAWLSTSPNKIVIAPHQWFAKGHLDTRDVCPPDWIRI
jgi:hypothetical protein